MDQIDREIQLEKYFRDERVSSRLVELEAKYSLEQKNVDLPFLIQHLRAGEFELDDLVSIFIDLYHLPADTAFDLNSELYDDVLEPVEEFLSEQHEEYIATGVMASQKLLKDEEDELEDASDKVALLIPSTFQGKLIQEIIRSTATEMEDPLMQKRLENVIRARLKDIRDDRETKDVFMRGIKVGGLEFPEEEAEALLQLIRSRSVEYQKFEKQDLAPLIPLQVKESIVRSKDVKRVAEEEKKKTEEVLKMRTAGVTDPATKTQLEFYGGTASPQTLIRKGEEPAETSLRKGEGQTEPPVSFRSKGGLTGMTVPISKDLPLNRSISGVLDAPRISTSPWKESLRENDFDHQLLPPHPVFAKEEPKPVLIYRGTGETQIPPQPPLRKMGEQTEPQVSPGSNGGLSRVTEEAQNQSPTLTAQKPLQQRRADVVNKRLIKRESMSEVVEPKPHTTSKVTLPPPKIQPRDIIEDADSYESKLTDLLTDIANMSLKNFQQLDKDPRKATAKIKQKIELLESERSLKGRVDGIKAWQASESYTIYLKIGRESMDMGKRIEQVIADRQKIGTPTLSGDGFYAIMEFNKELKF